MIIINIAHLNLIHFLAVRLVVHAVGERKRRQITPLFELLQKDGKLREAP